MGIREHDREYLGKKISGKEQKMGDASVVGWLKAWKKWGFLVVQWYETPLQGARVWFLVGKLRSDMPSSQKTKKKNI